MLLTDAPVALRRNESKTSAQVIVVGASLSGLQAAIDLQRAGLTCLVLEADDAVVPHGTPLVGETVHSRTQPRTVQLVRDLGLELTATCTSGKEIVPGQGFFGQDGLFNLGEDDRRSFLRVRNNLDSLCSQIDLNQPAQMLPNYGTTTVYEALVSHGATQPVLTLLDKRVLSIFGLSSRAVSMLYFLLYCKSAGGFAEMTASFTSDEQSMWLPGGRQRLRERLATRLAPGTLCLSQPVTRVDQLGQKCVISTASGDVFQSSRVIIAGTSICSTAEFQPGLSSDKEWLRKDVAFGSCANMILTYEQPWWREKRLPKHAKAFVGPTVLMRDTSDDNEACYNLLCILAEDNWDAAVQMTDRAQTQLAVEQIEAIFGPSVPAPSDAMILSPDSRSKMPQPPRLAIPAKRLRDLQRDQWKPEGYIHFAGAETSLVWRGHTEGALAAGSRAAEEVALSLVPTLRIVDSKL